MYLNPYAPVHADDKQQWLKTALHVHTTRSDGKETPAETIAHFQELGFDVIALTDHDLLGDASSMQGDTVLLQGIEHSKGSHVGQVGSLRIANHPLWHFDHWDFASLLQRDDLHGLEIYNGLTEAHPGTSLCTHLWDSLLSIGERRVGVASDDAHAREHRGFAWVCVDAERDPQAVHAALEAGRFYASSGVEIERIVMQGQELHIRCATDCEIRFIGDSGKLKHRHRACEAHYTLQEGDAYIRVECYGAHGTCAWTNPIWLTDAKSEKKRRELRTWMLKRLAKNETAA